VNEALKRAIEILFGSVINFYNYFRDEEESALISGIGALIYVYLYDRK